MKLCCSESFGVRKGAFQACSLYDRCIVNVLDACQVQKDVVGARAGCAEGLHVLSAGSCKSESLKRTSSNTTGDLITEEGWDLVNGCN